MGFGNNFDSNSIWLDLLRYLKQLFERFCMQKVKPNRRGGEKVSWTATYTIRKYDYPIDEFVDFVFKATSEEDAVHNAKLILEAYKKRLTNWELIKLLLK